MFLTHLSLTHFRNYHTLEIDFARRLTLLQGHNAQGKTNLLEALYLLATSKPVHAQTDQEVVDWRAQEEPIPYCRVAAVVRTEEDGRERTQELEIIYSPRSDGANFSKQVKVNGVNRRSMDLIGLMRAVLFLPEDIKLVDGSPGERRRYLDIALCQIDRVYCRALSAYQKVLGQRNSLLKNLRGQGVRAGAPETADQLDFWDEKLVSHGGVVVARRHNFVAQLDPLARRVHAELSGGAEQLSLHYRPSFGYGPLGEVVSAQGEADTDSQELADLASMEVNVEEVNSQFQAILGKERGRELSAGVTLYGPHRDDLKFLANRRDLRTFGSRGQQRSAALSLKLAEVEAMTQETGAAPLLLLDDVMSELDARRRSTLLAALNGVEQAILTTTDWEDFTPEFRQTAQCMHVYAGGVDVAGGEEVSATWLS